MTAAVAILRTDQDQRVVLSTLCRLGRSLDCAVEDDHPSVSRNHAEIRWSEGKWWLKDLNSANGTHLDGVRLGAARVELNHGATLRLGDSAREWTLIDMASPRARAHASSGDSVEGEERTLALPSQDAPIATVLATPAGWIFEAEDTSCPVSDRAEVTIEDGTTYRLELPAMPLQECSTVGEAGASLRNLVLAFDESLDAEYVRIVAGVGANRIDLGHRAHHELLILLARARVRDRQTGIPETESGWVYMRELEQALRRDEGTINVLIYRARKALYAAGFADAVDIVQRRLGVGQLRIGSRHLILEGST